MELLAEPVGHVLLAQRRGVLGLPRAALLERGEIAATPPQQQLGGRVPFLLLHVSKALFKQPGGPVTSGGARVRPPD